MARRQLLSSSVHRRPSISRLTTLLIAIVLTLFSAAVIPTVSAECGNCFGAGEQGQCCDTCEDIIQAYKKKGWSFKESDFGPCRDRDEANDKKKTEEKKPPVQQQKPKQAAQNNQANNNNNQNNNKKAEDAAAAAAAAKKKREQENAERLKKSQEEAQKKKADAAAAAKEQQQKKQQEQQKKQQAQQQQQAQQKKQQEQQQQAQQKKQQEQQKKQQEQQQQAQQKKQQEQQKQAQQKKPQDQQQKQQEQQKKQQEQQRKQQEEQKKQQAAKAQKEAADRKREEDNKRKAAEDERKRQEAGQATATATARRAEEEEEAKKKKKQEQEQAAANAEARKQRAAQRAAAAQEQQQQQQDDKKAAQSEDTEAPQAAEDTVVNRAVNSVKSKINEKIQEARGYHPLVEKTINVVGEASAAAAELPTGQAARNLYEKASSEAGQAAHRLADKVAPSVSAKYISESHHSFIGGLIVLVFGASMSMAMCICLVRSRPKRRFRMFRGCKEKADLDLVEEGAFLGDGEKRQPFKLYHEFEYTMRKRYQSNSYSSLNSSPPNSGGSPPNSGSSPPQHCNKYTYRQHSYGKDGQPVTVSASVVEEFKDKPIKKQIRRQGSFRDGVKYGTRMLTTFLGAAAVLYVGGQYVMPADMSWSELWLITAEFVDNRLLGHHNLVL